MIKLPDEAVEFFTVNYPNIFAEGALAEGEWLKKTSEWCKSYSGAGYSEVFNSNGSGIFAILSILKRFRGKTDYFIQSNTMYGVKTMSEAAGLTFVGAVPCELSSLMPTASTVEAFINTIPNPRHSVFILTHIGGWVNPEIEDIVKVCNAAGVALIEDCAHSLGATLNNKHTGTFGLAGVYSLYATKAVPAGEGGVLITDDEELGDLLSRFIMYDRFRQEMNIGVNMRMSELNALLAYSVIRHTDAIIDNKKTIAKRYEAVCERKGIVYLKPELDGQRSNLYKFIILDDTDQGCSRFRPITNRTSPVYDYTLGADPQNIIKNHICLPIWYKLEEDIVAKTVEQIALC
ncbi:MAG: DegT/DnrJ/EryC1/StrS family aminotransferase [Allomuricauda sp.]